MNDQPTPMMAQYLAIRDANPGALLFYRMGDFYEMFFDDAVQAAAALDIALTKRGTHQGEPIPMCGVPVHAAESYLLTLIRKGFRVAIAEQLEDPAEAKKRGSKSVVARDVVRLVTPGTLTEESLLEARRHNFLASFASVRESAALAWVDISTGAFQVMECAAARLAPELARLLPRELLVVEGAELAELAQDAGAALTELPAASFDSRTAERRLLEIYGVETLEGFAAFSRAELAAMGAIVSYLEMTQKGNLPLLRAPVRERARDAMQIDLATRRNLELTHSQSGGRENSLLAAIDRTVTAAGGRLLERRISAPSRDLTLIRARHDAVDMLVDQSGLSKHLREALSAVPDIDRALSRLALARGGPRDLAAIRAGLSQAAKIANIIPKTDSRILADAQADLRGHDALIAYLEQSLVAEPPILVRDGGFVAAGYAAELDETRQLRDEGRGVIGKMQADYVQLAGINSLKIKHNNVLGYFIETTVTHAEKMMAPPLSETFIHRQTTANQVRFTTVELAALETRILNARDRALEIERDIFEQMRSAVLAQSAAIGLTARALAEIDLAAGFADIARGDGWSRPQVDDSTAFSIEAGRHPVVERALRRQAGNFVANDCALTEGSTPAIWLLTGPNMAGKSTFLRQNALIAVLAQAGAFVPARRAHIGLVSQLFSRVGASDDLARGRSTFMVEMVETAAILNQADQNALVILDEIGRGTATWDGLSIAWAVMEHLHAVNRCRALFATHYHEMTALSARLEGVESATVAVREWEGDVIFLHEVRKGAADRSYGVQVARLAGLPASVVDRAREILTALESGEREGAARPAALIDDLPLFRAAPAAQPNESKRDTALDEKLRSVHPDMLTPREALDLIYELKVLSGDPR